MNPPRRALIIVLVLALASMACQSATDLVTTPTATASLTPTITLTPTRTPRPTKTSTPTPTPLVIKVDSVRKVISGGFNYAVLDGLEKDTNNHEVYMYSAGEKLSILLSARAPYPGEHINTSLKDFFAWTQDEYRNVVEGDREDFTQAGAEGVSKYFTGQTKDGKPFQGRITFLRPEKSKMLVILIYAYGENAWEEFGADAYQKTIEKISFFEITPWEGCPVSTKPSYGYSKESPIKVGGELLSGPDREEDYLSALLGQHGEVITYFRVDTVEVNGTIIDEYRVVYGSQVKTLYLDISHYEKSKAPAGMTCSGQLP